jgi:hypothetical protein
MHQRRASGMVVGGGGHVWKEVTWAGLRKKEDEPGPKQSAVLQLIQIFK